MAGGREQGRGDDAAGGALIAEAFPTFNGNELAEGWCAGFVGRIGWFDEIERSLEEEGGVGKRNGVSPGNVFGWIRVGGRRKFDAFAVVDDAVGAGGVSVP